MKLCDYSVDELRSMLQRSSVSTLLTEGRDDYSLFRGIGQRLGATDLLPAGGKSSVLSLRRDMHTFSCPNVAFLVDRDLWLFTGVPAGHSSSDLTITDGYSIENDLLRDSAAEGLIDDQELDRYRSDLDLAVQWYCAGVAARHSGAPFDFDRQLKTVIDPVTSKLTTSAEIDVATWPSDPAQLALVRADYGKLLRGKTWLQLIAKYTCAPPRVIQHSPKALLDIGLRSGGPYSTAIIQRLSAQLSLQ